MREACRVYVAGRMTGRPNLGFPDFEDGEDRVRAHGDEPVSPHRLNIDLGWVQVQRNGEGRIVLATQTSLCPSYEAMLAYDFKALGTCDAIYMLPGWQGGSGCIRELREAVRLGLDVWGPADEVLAVRDWLAENPAPAPLVGLVGYAQSGKDTFASGMGFRRLAFADPLKELAVACNPIVLPRAANLARLVRGYGWEYCKAEVPGVREFLQNLGTGVRDVLGADTWVEAAFAKYDTNVPTVFTDVRFPNEIRAIRERGGVIIRIDRPGVEPPNQHVSEFAWQDCGPEYVVVNDGTLEQFLADARFHARNLSGGRTWDV